MATDIKAELGEVKLSFYEIKSIIYIKLPIIYIIDRVIIKLNNVPDAIEINNADVIKSCITYLSIED